MRCARKGNAEGGLSHHHGTRETLNPRVPVNLLAPGTVSLVGALHILS